MQTECRATTRGRQGRTPHGVDVRERESVLDFLKKSMTRRLQHSAAGPCTCTSCNRGSCTQRRVLNRASRVTATIMCSRKRTCMHCMHTRRCTCARPYHGAHSVVDPVRSVGGSVALRAPCVEARLRARLVRVVVQRLAANVLVTHRVARAALRHVDGLVWQRLPVHSSSTVVRSSIDGAAKNTPRTDRSRRQRVPQRRGKNR